MRVGLSVSIVARLSEEIIVKLSLRCTRLQRAWTRVGLWACASRKTWERRLLRLERSRLKSEWMPREAWRRALLPVRPPTRRSSSVMAMTIRDQVTGRAP